MFTARPVRALLAFLFILSSCASVEKYRDCVHGELLRDGKCHCHSCWSGPSCSSYASRPPKFARNFDTTALTLAQRNNDLGWKIVYRAEASDPDLETCQETSGCPCSKVKYFIVSQEQASDFRVDPDTGEVSVFGDSHDLYSEYQLTLGVTDDGSVYDTMTLTVSGHAPASKYLLDTAGDLTHLGYPEAGPLTRRKRDVTLPQNVTFTLSKYGANTNLTEIRVGVRILFRLDMVFPKGTTDIQVELFAPDSDSIVMMLCNVKVVVGNNLGVSGRTDADMESQDNSLYNDRAVIKLGTVTNSGKDLTSNVPNTLTVTYEAVMIQSNTTVSKQEYWVSAGAEYNKESDVWVGQASFVANIIDDSQNFSATPNVTITGPKSLAIGSCGTYNFQMSLNRPSAELKFDLFAPSNDSDVMCVCSTKVLSASEAYQCGLKSRLDDYRPQFTVGANSQGFSHASIDLGRALNKLAREYGSSPNSSYQGVITFGAQLCMNNDPGLVGKTYSVGSSIQVGKTTIWTGQVSVTADPKQPSQPVTPHFYMTFPFGQTISRSKPAFVHLSMEVPENSIADYLLQVFAPTLQGAAIFQVCSISFLSVGENLACLGQRKLNVLHSMTLSTSIYPDVANVTLGPIHNPGTMGTVPFGSSNLTNTVTFQIAFKATDNPEAKVGSVHTVSFGMFVGAEKLSVGSTNLTVVDETGGVNVTGASMPQVNLTLLTVPSGRLPVGMTGQLLMDIRSARNVSYSPFSVEFIMPNASQEPLIKICKVRLQSVGANNPCVVAEAVERSVQMVPSYVPGVADRAIINMDSLCNIQIEDDEREDHFILAASVMLTKSQQLQSNTPLRIDAGITYNKMAVNVLRMDVNADLVYNPAPLIAPPSVAVLANNGNMTSIPWGAPFRYLIRIKTAPNDSTPLSLSVSTQDDALSVCGLRFVRAGEAYPCLEPPTGVLTSPDPMLGLNRGGSIDMAMITNVGSTPPTSDNEWDPNTIELELFAKMTLDSSLAAEGSSHALSLVVSYNAGYSSKVTATVTVTATSDTALSNVPWLVGTSVNGTMAAASITGQEKPPTSEMLTTIVPSESKRFVISLETSPGTTSNLSVAVTTPTGGDDVLEIVYIGLLYAGDNLPCVKSGQSQAKYESRTGTGPGADIGTLSLGFVCNTGTVVNDTTGSANTIKIEYLVRLLTTAKLNSGSTLNVQGVLMTNNQQMKLDSITLTVGDPGTFEDVYPADMNETARVDYNSTEQPIVVAISELRTFPVVVTVPPFSSSKVTLDVSSPISTASAIMTVMDVKVVRTGRNLPKLELCGDDFVVTTLSAYNTSQVTKYVVQLGVVSNAGISYRDGRNATDVADDTISVDVTLQMADNRDAVNGSKYNVSFGVRVTKFVFILDVNVTVARTGTEELIFNISSDVDLANSTTTRTVIDFIYRLSNLSTAEGQDAIFVLFLPVYVTHVSSVITSPLKAIAALTVENSMVTISFGTLFFTDEIHLTIVLAANSSYLVPLGVTGQDSVLAIQPVADTHTSSNYTPYLTYISFSIATNARTTSQCAIRPLGMESGSILDCQISSSPDSIAHSGPLQGRYNTGTGWSPFVHTGTANQERYFQVFFGNQVLVNGLKLQQTGPSYATSLSLSYSNDGLAWVDSASQMSPTATPDQELNVPSPQVSRYLRVRVSALDNEKQKATFRFEFMGCVIVNASTDPCAQVVQQATPLPEFVQRTFIKAGPTLYVSVGVKGSRGIEQKSFATSDDRTWREVDGRVGCIFGFEQTKGRLLAVSAGGDSYLTSLDGDLWYTVPPSDVLAARALPSYKPAVTVPVDGNNALNYVTPNSTYTDSAYGATVDGIMVNSGGWKTIFTWAKCS